MTRTTKVTEWFVETVQVYDNGDRDVIEPVAFGTEAEARHAAARTLLEPDQEIDIARVVSTWDEGELIERDYFYPDEEAPQ
jgi:hypothetical protein